MKSYIDFDKNPNEMTEENSLDSYQDTIRFIIAKLGYIGKYNPRHIEAYMRLQYSTLDHLSYQDFVNECKICIKCIDAEPIENAEKLAQSYGL